MDEAITIGSGRQNIESRGEKSSEKIWELDSNNSNVDSDSDYDEPYTNKLLDFKVEYYPCKVLLCFVLEICNVHFIRKLMEVILSAVGSIILEPVECVL